jgi:hypothetical protein
MENGEPAVGTDSMRIGRILRLLDWSSVFVEV